MWIRKLKNILLDLFFPCYCIFCHQPGKIICPECLKKIVIKGEIKPGDKNLEKIICFFNFHQPKTKKAIHFFKYFPYQKSVLTSLFPLIQKFFNQNKQLVNQIKKNNFVLVPIPLTKRKKAQRGFNQAELIALKLSQELKIPLMSGLIKKTKNTPSQTKLSFDQRINNVDNIFKVQKQCPKQIILVDDVLTTGATLRQAAKKLSQAGAQKIWAIVLASG